MARWDYDQVFYRVFCVTLLGIAFAFTVILTNVFIDIDGLLYKKNKDTPHPVKVSPILSTREVLYEDFEQDRERKNIDRPSPNLKNLIKSRLASYLEQMENEQKTDDEKEKEKPDRDREREENSSKSDKEEEIKLLKELESNADVISDIKQLKSKTERNEELLHLAVHNIVLQGIIGKVDLKKVYKKVQDYIREFEKHEGKSVHTPENSPVHGNGDTNFVKELLNCKRLQSQVDTENIKTDQRKEELLKGALKKIRTKTVKANGQKLVINTVIDIKSINNEKATDIDSKDFNGIVKVIYNGKAMKFRKMDEKPVISKSNYGPEATTCSPVKKTNKKPSNINIKKMLNDFLKQTVSEEVETAKRQKRHIKIEYEADNSNVTKTKQEDDELFVEIETHFDSKGLKGDRKKKMIRDLVGKIQKALHSDKDSAKKKKHAKYHVKKRTQNPLDAHVKSVDNKMVVPYTENLVHREIETLSKNPKILKNYVQTMANNYGQDWQKLYTGPNFLKQGKLINSAEMNEMYTDYHKVSDTGIPQRLTKPLNNEENPMDYLNNVKFMLKDIEGSGFAIGINQFTDAAPDPEAIKLFTGLEHVLKTYHQTYDQEENLDEDLDLEKNKRETAYVNGNMHNHDVFKRSIGNAKKHDYHDNEYKIIFNKNYVPYDTYQDIYNFNFADKEGPKPMKKSPNLQQSLLLDDNILSRNLKPSEIFSLANIFQRKKRAIKLKKVVQLKNKKVLNKYLNTHHRPKHLMRQRKRHKRQVNKIRIVARDMSDRKANSEEEIFFVSDEKLFADRAVVKEVLTPNLYPRDDSNMMSHNMMMDEERKTAHIDVIGPTQINNDHFDIITPYVFETREKDRDDSVDTYSKVSRHNPLMSRYPHIFLEEYEKEPEYKVNVKDYSSDVHIEPSDVEVNTTESDNIVEINQKINVELQNSPESFRSDVSQHTDPQSDTYSLTHDKPFGLPKDVFDNYELPKEVGDAALPIPEESKGKYKITVKIMPKNATDPNGFKEVHTSINKSYNKNGLIYTSLVNVSELSKIEKENSSVNNMDYETAEKLRKEHRKIKMLIVQHKKRLEEQLAQIDAEQQNIDNLLLNSDASIPVNPTPVAEILTTAATTTTKTTATTSRRTTTTAVTTTASTTTPTTTTTHKTTTTTKTTTPSTTTTRKTTKPTTTARTTHKPTTTPMNVYLRDSSKDTATILSKINENNEILQKFLGKIFHKLEEKATEKPVVTTRSASSRMITKPPSPYARNMEFFDQIKNMFLNTPNHEVFKNDTIAIPFVYAYQQPLNINANVDPKANIVYHGHIHADAGNMDAKIARRDNPPIHPPVQQMNNVPLPMPLQQIPVQQIPVQLPIMTKKIPYNSMKEFKIPRPELQRPELQRPELPRPELQRPELQRPELRRLELQRSEMQRPELQRPDLRRPELQRSELQRPELPRPELQRPELQRPELQRPALRRPELQRPELQRPELQRPDMQTQKPKPYLTAMKDKYKENLQPMKNISKFFYDDNPV